MSISFMIFRRFIVVYLAMFFGALSIQSHLHAEVLLNEKMNKEIKVLILIIACDNNTSFPDSTENDPVYPELQKAWRSYMHLDPEHIEAYFMKHRPNLSTQFMIEGDTIWCQGEETWIPGILNKTLVSMEAMLPKLDEFDFVLRTNLSSFYVFPRLIEFLKTLPKKMCYCGVIIPYYNFTLISGAGIIFSTDLVRLLVQNKEEVLSYGLIDDVSIGAFFLKYQIPLLNASRIDFTDISLWNSNKNQIPHDAFHFRTKNPRGLRLTDEIFIQLELFKMFYGEGLQN